MKRPKFAMAKVSEPPAAKKAPRTLLGEVRDMILQARAGVARAVDSGLVLLYWHVGRRIRQDILKERRGEYGERIVSALGRQLSAEFGEGFGIRNLFRMIRFAEVFPDLKIVSALRTQLGWTHFRQIIALDDPLKRDFYAEMCRIENWSTRTLEKKVGGMLFERTALSRNWSKATSASPRTGLSCCPGSSCSANSIRPSSWPGSAWPARNWRRDQPCPKPSSPTIKTCPRFPIDNRICRRPLTSARRPVRRTIMRSWMTAGRWLDGLYLTRPTEWDDPYRFFRW